MTDRSFLLISHEMTYSGAPRSLYNLAKCLLEEGHRVTVWSLETGVFFEEFASLGLDVVYVSAGDLKSAKVKKALSRFDLVIANTIFCAEAALEAQKVTKTVLFLGEARNIHRIVSDHSIDRKAAGSVENIACVSVYARRALEKFFGRKDIAVIHNYTEDYNCRGELKEPEEENIRFMVSGTLEHRKGQDLAIKAFRSIPADLRKNASLHIVGKKPAWSKKYCKSLEFGNGVFLKNEIQDRKDLFEYYKQMDVIIVPSRDEACSMVALEAAMLGKAVIVSDHVGGSYICSRDHHFRSGDAGDLQDKMEIFLKDPELIMSEGIKNRKAFTMYASKNNTKKELNAYLERLGVISPDEKSKKDKARLRRRKNTEAEKIGKAVIKGDKELDTGGRQVIPIVFATDTNYAPFAAAVIRSITANKSDDHFYSIYVLYDDTLTFAMHELLGDMGGEGVSVRLVDVSRCVEEDSLYLSGHYSMQMYYRWLIPELFRHYDKVLYLDCDLAVRGDVAELYNMDIGDHYVGMVNNTVRTSFKNYVEETLGLPVDDYYNSGVILFNNEAYIKARVKEKCIDFINRDRDLLCPDQDAINVCCRGHICRLPDEWNFQWHHMIPGVEIGGFTSDYKKRYEKVLKKGAKIIHYTSYKKPWNEPELKLADVFWKYFKKIPGYERLMKKNAYGKKGIERAMATPTGRIEESVHYKERIDFLQHSLDETRNSATYRIGRAITAVPRRVRHILTGAPL